MTDSFQTQAQLSSGGKNYHYRDLQSLQAKYNVARLPFSLKILLENLLRLEDGVTPPKSKLKRF